MMKAGFGMDEREDPNRMGYVELFALLQQKRCVHPVWKKVLDLLDRVKVSEMSLRFLCFFFSFSDDGDACVPLNAKELFAKWVKKWNGVKVASGIGAEESGADYEEELQAFGEMISLGVESVSREIEMENSALRSFFRKQTDAKRCEWLFSRRLYDAVRSISLKVRSGGIFDDVSHYAALNADDSRIRGIISEFRRKTSGSSHPEGISLEPEQAKCVMAAIDGCDFLIIGGPGTGKTAVAAFMLWKILCENPQCVDWDLRFAAPSGKAAQRIAASIRKSLDNLSEKEKTDHADVTLKLSSAKSMTIEKLLDIGPDGRFRINGKNPFDPKSILVIDEASMIDVTKFSALLEAISPKTGGDGRREGPRIFVLGDDKQIPSVEEGAVLGDILASDRRIVLGLVKSKRFDDDSRAGRLANAIKAEKKGCCDFLSGAINSENRYFICPNANSEDEFIRLFDRVSSESRDMVSYPVFRIQPADPANWRKTYEQAAMITSAWIKAFSYGELGENPGIALHSQILCVLKSGANGCDAINAIADSQMKAMMRKRDPKAYAKYAAERFYPGQKVMVLRNLNSLGLFNGDAGEICEKNAVAHVFFPEKGDDEKMIPLDAIPQGALAPSYAITVHKSQGSGYKDVLIFFPERKNHPLLSRQMLYTALTRTEGRTFLVASMESVRSAICNVQERYTGLGCFEAFNGS